MAVEHLVDFHTGHVIDMLRGLPENSVQTVVTSPPYFGLRDYGLEPVVWEPVVYAPMPGLAGIRVPEWADPDRWAACDHEWDEWVEDHDVREMAIAGKTRTTDRSYGGDASRRFDGNHQKHRHGQFCRRCGAWRGCLGLEPSVDLYIGHLVQVFREVRRVLRPDGTLWLNLGDSYAGGREHAAGIKPKDLLGVPWRAAFALRSDGWWLRSDIVFAKLNPMPESVTDRPTRAHEFHFLLTKSERYFYDHIAIREPSVTKPQRRLTQRHSERDAHMRPDKIYPYRLSDVPIQQQSDRNRRDVWTISTKPYAGAHFAVMPVDLVEPCVLAGTSEAGACAQCGAPWERVVEREISDAPDSYNGSSFDRGKSREAREFLASVGTAPRTAGVRTTGWRPTCRCGTDDRAPCVVLDPFGGSGTVALVARKLGRRAWYIDASPDYRDLAEERLGLLGKQETLLLG
ncbi:DNA-methyltransferase [Acidithiobacillus caldus]|nr:site-specific DNA-methyltransferase [Acidithiobacillus caldus]